MFLCETCHWVQPFDEVESPLPTILYASSKLELTSTRFRALIGAQDDTPEEHVELPRLIYDEAFKPRRHLIKLANACPTVLKHVRLFFKFQRLPGDDDVGSLVAVPTGIQTAIDAVVDWAHGGRQDELSWRRLCAYVEQESLGINDPAARMIQAFPQTALPTLRYLRRLVDDSTIREHFGKSRRARVSDAQRMRFFVEVSLGGAARDEDDRWKGIFPLDVVASDGRSAVVPRSMMGAMMSAEYEHEWYPPCRD